MNNCCFTGRMGKDPKFTQGDANSGKKSFISFSLAIKKGYKVAQGQSDTDWLNFKAFGQQADLINKYVTTGRMVSLVATAAVEEWTDSTTQAKRSRVVFMVDKMTFCDSNKDGAQGGGQAQGGNAGYTPAAAPYVPGEDDDLPF